MSANARTEVQIPMIEHNKQAVSGDFIQPGPRDTATSPTWASSFHVTSHVQPHHVLWAPSLSVIGQRNRTTNAYADTGRSPPQYSTITVSGRKLHTISERIGDHRLSRGAVVSTVEVLKPVPKVPAGWWQWR